MVTTHALFAMKVQHKLRNRVAGSFAAGSFLIGRIGAKFANLSDAAGSAKRPRGDAGRDRPAGHRRRRSSNANGLCWRILAEPTGVITRSQIHGSRTDSWVRVLHAQPRSRVSGDARGHVGSFWARATSMGGCRASLDRWRSLTANFGNNVCYLW